LTIKARDARRITAAEMKFLEKQQDTLEWIKKQVCSLQKNVTPVLDKIQEYRRNWLQHVNRMPCNRLPRIKNTRQTNRQKKPGETVKETSGCVRLERVNKWLHSMLARWC
jgi:hypothetical protein